MTRRKSKREIERAVENLGGGEYPPATLEDVLMADAVESAPDVNADGIVWRLDGEERTIPKPVAADAVRVWLEGEPKRVDPEDLPDGALNRPNSGLQLSAPEEEI
jgi:hypothetical protein